MTKNILILGSSGMLGKALVNIGCKLGYQITGVSVKNSDIKLDIRIDEDVENFISKNSFDIVINTCSYVNHDFCNNNPLEAYNLNSRPNALLTMLAEKYNFKYVYISTDGYFNGDTNKKHDENCNIEFYNEYAKTKYAGECYTIINPNSLVVRTNITGFRGLQDKPTFFEWVLSSLKNKDKITLFDDYYTSTISTTQFARALYKLLEKDASGIINLASSEVSSKKDFIVETARQFGFSLENTTTGSIQNLQGSKRADSLGLDVSKAEKILGYKLPNLKEVIGDLRIEYEKLEK